MPTIKDVSERAGVSSATVSHVINATRYVSDEVKERVFKAIEELDYKPNFIARTLRSGKSNTVGLIVPNTLNPYFTEIAWCIEQVAHRRDYSVIICNTENKPDKEEFYLNVLIRKQVDGIIFIASGDYKGTTDVLASARVPHVMLDRELPDSGDSCAIVMTDEQAGAEMAMEHLVSLGHKRIACVTGGALQVASVKRLDGYNAVLRKHGIEQDPDLIVSGDYQMQSGYVAGCALLKQPHRPTAVFAFNDLMAFGVLRAAADNGINVPGDLSLVGFDNIEMAAYSIPTLTTVSQSKEEIAAKAFALLMRIINNQRIKERTIVLRPKMIIRNTTDIPAGSK